MTECQDSDSNQFAAGADIQAHAPLSYSSGQMKHGKSELDVTQVSPKIGDKVQRNGNDFNFLRNWLRTLAAWALPLDGASASASEVRVHPVGYPGNQEYPTVYIT